MILLPEVVAREQGLIGVLVVQPAEAVFGLTAMGPAVQVAVPVDLDAHDSSLEEEDSEKEVTKPPDTVLLCDLPREVFTLWSKYSLKGFSATNMGPHTMVAGSRCASWGFPSGPLTPFLLLKCNFCKPSLHSNSPPDSFPSQISG